ncbi:hypothetical protein C6P40_005000 [Pichia californica]|uniref:Amino acid permease/ SLC12A domain-containing protein n=1 Tax=Pichia californica TaxID=460514 RepID=A0A9P7BHI5_9ASCO|nr:hypothetical protein C6P42_005357 [[Candida] californica]KAG0689463.1 hypothetical protein C6P40_005000 [[Candida] californica]
MSFLKTRLNFSNNEKKNFVEETATFDAPIEPLDSNKSIQLDQHGNVSEDQVLARDFKARHVSMMAIASAIGTGLIIGSGTAYQKGGAAALFVGYIFTGTILIIVLFSLGEMAAMCPMDKAFSGYCTRFCDKSLGFAAGWNYFFNYALTLASELSAVGIIIQFWRPDLNPGIFVAVFIVVTTAGNFLSVRFYGEVEFWVSVVKLITLAICFITCLVISCGGGPDHTTVGFQYWRHGNAFLQYKLEGGPGRFLGWWACVIQSVFAYAGSECIGIIFGEAPDPRKVVPKATRQVFVRICGVYILGVFLLSIAVSPTNPRFATASHNAGASPFVIAIETSGIRVLPSFVNACLLFFVGGAANSDIYLGSRSLYGLARDGMAPKIFLKLNRFGIPYYGSVFTALFGLLAFMTTSSGASNIFGYLTSAVSVFSLLTWLNVLIAYITFYHATEYQKIPREDIPFRMWFQPYLSYVAIFFICIIIFFNGWDAFVTEWNYREFLTCYVGVFVYVVMILGYKIVYKTKRVTRATAKIYNYVEHVISDDEQIDTRIASITSQMDSSNKENV